MKNIAKLFLILFIAGLYPAIITYFTGAISENLIFFYYPFLYQTVTLWIFIVWYLGFLVYGAINYYRNIGESKITLKIVSSVLLLSVSLIAFTGLLFLVLIISYFNSSYKLVQKCDGYSIASKSTGGLGNAKYYFGVKDYTAIRLGEKDEIKDCKAKITLITTDGRNTSSDNQSVLYVSPFATQAEVARTPQVESILKGYPNGKIIEYKPATSITIKT